MKGTALDLRDRRKSLAILGSEKFDLLIIGAGITGCGVARDAAMRGLRVALIDANDIGAGTSSRSSKLIHGGLRYLTQKDLFVVREAANERRVLREIAPHLSRTMPMVILARSKKGITGLRAVLWSYEKMGHVDKHEQHHIWDTDRLRIEEPAVMAESFSGAVVYPEYLTDDFRLTLANAQSAAHCGAVVVTYAAAEKIIIENGRAVGSVVRSTLPGEEEKAEVRARIIVNATGPWVDVIRRLEDSGAKEKLQLTKGIHVVFSRDRFPINQTIIMMTPDRRSVFAVPREGFVYLGTTDTFYPKPEYWPEITHEDIDYLTRIAVRDLHVGPLKDDDIVALWAGIRPLLGAKGKKPSEISRRNEVIKGPTGLLTVAGGKLTSYRSMAERVVNECEKDLGQKPSSCTTTDEPLPGGDFTGTFEDLQSRVEGLGLSPYEAERAARLYGSVALSLYEEGGGPAVEAAHAVKYEGALTLEDYWLRRSSRARFDKDGGMGALEPAAESMGKFLNWSHEERVLQIEGCRARRAKEMRPIREL